MNLEEGLPFIILALTVKGSLSRVCVCVNVNTKMAVALRHRNMTHRGLVAVLLATIFHLSFKTNEPTCESVLVWALSQSRPVKARQERMSQPRLDTATVRVPSKEMKMRERRAVGLHITIVLTPQFCWRHCCSERTEKEGAWAPQTQHTYIFNRLNFTYCLNGSCIFNDSFPHWHGNRYPAIVVLQWGVEPCCGDFSLFLG